MLWVWYYDRQGIIQSDGINIIADFPRFLLLQVFQRFTLEDWGVIPSLNPDATRAHEDDSTLRVATGIPSLPITNLDPAILENSHLQEEKIKSILLQLKQFLSHEPHCLAGRATADIAATAGIDGDSDSGMVCKIYHPEIQPGGQNPRSHPPHCRRRRSGNEEKSTSYVFVWGCSWLYNTLHPEYDQTTMERMSNSPHRRLQEALRNDGTFWHYLCQRLARGCYLSTRSFFLKL
jgi:hypothetical protein